MGQRTARRSSSARTNGAGSSAPAEKAAPDPPAPAPANGVFVLVERADDGGLGRPVALPQGDVRPAEILTILEVAVAAVRANLGLPAL